MIDLQEQELLKNISILKIQETICTRVLVPIPGGLVELFATRHVCVIKRLLVVSSVV